MQELKLQKREGCLCLCWPSCCSTSTLHHREPAAAVPCVLPVLSSHAAGLVPGFGMPLQQAWFKTVAWPHELSQGHALCQLLKCVMGSVVCRYIGDARIDTVTQPFSSTRGRHQRHPAASRCNQGGEMPAAFEAVGSLTDAFINAANPVM